MQFVSTLAAMFMQIRTFISPIEGVEFNNRQKFIFISDIKYYSERFIYSYISGAFYSFLYL